MELTHFNEAGLPRMVDVGAKPETKREAVAYGRVLVNRDVFELIKAGDTSANKGNVLATAQVGGIMGAKRTPDIIPMCHPVTLTGVDITFELNDTPDNNGKYSVEITAAARCAGATGVEMEALTAVSVAALTIYDMCKAVQKDIAIENIHLLKKSGGKSGEWTAGN
ncbi:MAG: cyclic pyranopterin monophosphate synthase MoaC [Oscillospiraceae bacterium]|jgi:cyclic pyranopterin phosphate synthase|nr:cyclic pyranopterin monophosphate synthase MoaC [Oscillospiraceae bacterium]